MTTPRIIYKICSSEEWKSARVSGVFEGAPVDRADGFIHFSTALQVEETAARHFAGREDLLLVSFSAEKFGPALKWEPSRGGDLFPHLYGTLRAEDADTVERLPLGPDGHLFPVLED